MKFHLQQPVSLSDKERGVVVGRAEYSNSEPTYLLRYEAADGRMIEAWWPEDALKTFSLPLLPVMRSL